MCAKWHIMLVQSPWRSIDITLGSSMIAGVKTISVADMAAVKKDEAEYLIALQQDLILIKSMDKSIFSFSKEWPLF